MHTLPRRLQACVGTGGNSSTRSTSGHLESVMWRNKQILDRVLTLTLDLGDGLIYRVTTELDL